MQIRLTSLSYQLIDKMRNSTRAIAKYTQHQPKVVTIPVDIDSWPSQVKDVSHFLLITASRLAKKNTLIGWSRRSLRLVRKYLNFWYYGSGGEDSLLRESIATHQAEYIQLKGHAGNFRRFISSMRSPDGFYQWRLWFDLDGSY